MKLIALIALVAVFSIASAVGTAKTLTNPPGNANEQAVNGVAGPPPHAIPAPTGGKEASQPHKATLRKAKIKNPPPMHDPN